MANDNFFRVNHDIHRRANIASRLSNQCLHSLVWQKSVWGACVDEEDDVDGDEDDDNDDEFELDPENMESDNEIEVPLEDEEEKLINLNFTLFSLVKLDK